MRFDVFAAVKMWVVVLWIVTPRSSVIEGVVVTIHKTTQGHNPVNHNIRTNVRVTMFVLYLIFVPFRLFSFPLHRSASFSSPALPERTVIIAVKTKLPVRLSSALSGA
jgi:hypothetical protein